MHCRPLMKFYHHFRSAARLRLFLFSIIVCGIYSHFYGKVHAEKFTIFLGGLIPYTIGFPGLYLMKATKEELAMLLMQYVGVMTYVGYIFYLENYCALFLRKGLWVALPLVLITVFFLNIPLRLSQCCKRKTQQIDIHEVDIPENFRNLARTADDLQLIDLNGCNDSETYSIPASNPFTAHYVNVPDIVGAQELPSDNGNIYTINESNI